MSAYGSDLATDWPPCPHFISECLPIFRCSVRIRIEHGRFFPPKMSALRSNLSQHKAGSFRDKRKYPYMAGKVTSRLKKGVTLFTEFCKRQYWMRGFWFLPCFKFPKVCYKNGKRISDNGDKHGGRETCGAW